MPKRQSNRIQRRIVPKDAIDPEVLDQYANQARYTGSPIHKRYPADYGFHPPVSPRPDKSLCDGSRIVKRAEAKALFQDGIKRGMVSACTEGELPKYVWAMDEYGHVYEAKRGGDGSEYHGYELSDDDGDMKRLVIKEWNLRCRTNS